MLKITSSAPSGVVAELSAPSVVPLLAQGFREFEAARFAVASSRAEASAGLDALVGVHVGGAIAHLEQAAVALGAVCRAVAGGRPAGDSGRGPVWLASCFHLRDQVELLRFALEDCQDQGLERPTISDGHVLGEAHVALEIWARAVRRWLTVESAAAEGSGHE